MAAGIAGEEIFYLNKEGLATLVSHIKSADDKLTETLEAEIERSEKIDADHESRISSLEDRADTNDDDIAAIQARLLVDEENIEKNTNAIDKLNGDENTDGSVANTVKIAKEELEEELADAVSTVYKYKGTITADEIATILAGSDLREGDVYNVSEDFYITDAFIDYSGDDTVKIEAGTNIVVTKVDDTYYFDVLAIGMQDVQTATNDLGFSTTKISSDGTVSSVVTDQIGEQLEVLWRNAMWHPNTPISTATIVAMFEASE